MDRRASVVSNLALPHPSPVTYLPPRPVAANCSTPFWDPIKGECICNSATCAFTDQSRPIGPNGANLTGDQVSSSGDGASASATSNPYVPFNGNGAAPLAALPAGLWAATVVGVVGALAGAYGAVARF